MSVRKHQYVVDDKGNRIAVILEMTEYETLMEEIEELEAIRAYDAARASAEESIPFEQAVDEIERGRR
jgi:PHD/YefM family antitoxin component YafN of YafNO toxin-antitoxin module